MASEPLEIPEGVSKSAMKACESIDEMAGHIVHLLRDKAELVDLLKYARDHFSATGSDYERGVRKTLGDAIAKHGGA